MDPVYFEQTTGVRATYLAIPQSQTALEALHVPLAYQVTPLKKLENLITINSKPLKCVCGAIANPYCNINYNTKSWFCCICQKNNKFPQNYAQTLSPNQLPVELEKDNIVLEYDVTDEKIYSKSSFVFLIDLCMNLTNFNSLKSGLISAIKNLDMETNEVAIIAYSRNVFVYKNTSTNSVVQNIMIPAYADDEFKRKSLYVKIDKGKILNGAYLKPKYFTSDVDALTKMINSLEPDFWLTPDDERPLRATGKALEITLDLMHYTKTEGARIMLLTSGAATVSNGAIADVKIANFIRKQPDLEDGKEKKAMIDAAKKYYSELTARAVSFKACIDIVAFSLDEFGLFEMRDLAMKTGGIVVINEEFKQSHFLEAVTKLFSKNTDGILNLHSNGLLETFASQELKICGCIGNCNSMNTKPANQGENKIAETNTHIWYLGGLDPSSTFTLFYEISENSKSKGYPTGHNSYTQFVTYYKENGVKTKIRVITIEKPFLTYGQPHEFLNYIDQFSVVSVFAKIAAYRSLEQDPSIVIRYLDKKLIGLLRLFKSGDNIPDQLNIIPQYFYYVRKSQFVKKNASSLDEMVFYRQSLISQNVDNTLVMIQPQIIEYSLNNEEPVPVLPNLSCLKSDVVLLADTYFNIIIWYGNNIKSWIDEGYHLQEGYEHIKELIENPEEDMKLILEDRLLVPNKVFAHFGSPTERFLKSRLNPETKDQEMNEAVEAGNFVSDDASLSTFMKKLFQIMNAKD